MHEVVHLHLGRVHLFSLRWGDTVVGTVFKTYSSENYKQGPRKCSVVSFLTTL